MRVYLYLSARSPGTRYLTKENRLVVADALDLSERHIRTCIQRLTDEFGWLGKLNEDTAHYIVRGFGRMLDRRNGEMSYHCSVLDNTAGILEDAEQFKGWLVASHIGGIARRKTHIFFRKLKIPELRYGGEELLYGSKKCSSTPSRHSHSTFYWPLAAGYIQKSLDCSISTASEYRALAERCGFIELRRHRLEVSAADLVQLQAIDSPLLQRIKKQRGRLLLDGITAVRPAERLQFKEMRTRRKKKLSPQRSESLQGPRSDLMSFLNFDAA